MTFVSGADAGHLAAFCADGDSKDDVVFYSPSGLSPFAGNFDGDVSGGYGVDDLFVYAPGSGSDDMWWGGSRTDFGTAASAKGLAPAPMSASYGDDVAGLRSSKSVTVGTTTTVTAQTWSAIDAVPALLGDRVTGADRWLVYGPGGVPVEQTNPDGTAWWLHTDQLGSVRVATAATGASPGTVVGTRSFDAYGNPATSTGVTPLVGYAGQYHDTETGYQYLRARYYDPETAQFLTLDPAIRATGEPYGYTGNNPLNATDPSGKIGIQIGPVKLGDGCPLGKNPDGRCRGARAIEKYADDVSNYAGGIAAACSVAVVVTAETGVGLAVFGFCAETAVQVAVVSQAVHTAVTCNGGIDDYGTAA